MALCSGIRRLLQKLAALAHLHTCSGRGHSKHAGAEQVGASLGFGKMPAQVDYEGCGIAA